MKKTGSMKAQHVVSRVLDLCTAHRRGSTDAHPFPRGCFQPFKLNKDASLLLPIE